MAGDIETLLDARTIAVVGLSPNPDRDSNRVAAYLKDHGYQVVPVNPNVARLLDQESYPDLASVPLEVDVVNVFRRSEYLAGIVDEALAKGVRGIWTQLGVVDDAAARRARAAGLVVVEDRCIMVEHRRRR